MPASVIRENQHHHSVVVVDMTCVLSASIKLMLEESSTGETDDTSDSVAANHTTTTATCGQHDVLDDQDEQQQQALDLEQQVASEDDDDNDEDDDDSFVESERKLALAKEEDDLDNDLDDLLKRAVEESLHDSFRLEPAEQSEPTHTHHSRRRSCLQQRASCNDFDYILSKKKYWKGMPAPDIDALRASQRLKLIEAAEDDSTHHSIIRNHHPPHARIPRVVSFGDISIRSYDQTIGDNPSVTCGPPIGLDWTYEEYNATSVDEYELARAPRRKPRQMMINYYNRKNLLTWRFGVSEEELSKAESEANRTKFQRAVTKVLLPAQKLEEVVQSAARKTKRLMKHK